MRPLALAALASLLVACGDDPAHFVTLDVSGSGNTTGASPLCVEVSWTGELTGEHVEDACSEVTFTDGQFATRFEGRPFDANDEYVRTGDVFLRLGNSEQVGAVTQRSETNEDGVASVVLVVSFAL